MKHLILNLWRSTVSRWEMASVEDQRVVPGLVRRLRGLVKDNSALLLNASSLVGTRVITSGFGFVYWWLAARMFAPEVVGFASAAVSAMMLLGTIGVLGLGTLLINELARRPSEAASLVVTALLVTGAASVLLGVLFVFLAPYISPDLAPLSQNVLTTLLFAVGVSLTSVILVLDQALIGILHGDVQLWRNGIFAVGKLIALGLVGLLLVDNFGLLIYATWTLGNVMSLIYVMIFGISKAKSRSLLPRWKWLRELKGPALRHYSLNLALQVPGFTLPLIVTALLSTKANASFYVTWMIATSLFMVPQSLTTMLYAVGAANPAVLSEKTRFTLRVSLLIGVLGVAVLAAGARPILGLFGESYVEQASVSLRLLALGVFPIIVKSHFVAISQIRGRMLNAAGVMAIGAVFELAFAATGASMAGLTGLCIGWVLAVCIEALMSTPLVVKVIRAGRRQGVGA